MNARRLLLAAGLAAATASTIALLALDPVLTAAYEGRGPAILVGIIEGRDVHPLSFYQDLAATRIRLPLLATAALGLLAAIAAASTPRRRQRLARMADGRAGLALTVLAVLGVLAVLLMALSRDEGIELSHGTGFYDEPFDLVITSWPVETLYYTLDGSQPDPDTNPDATRTVDGPIRIVDRSDEPNVYAEIPTTVEEYREFRSPDFPVPKATVLRVRGEGTQEVFATFFVGERVAPVTLPTISLIAEPAYLFDDAIGIRVPGDLTTAWRESDRYRESPTPPQIEANYQMRGREWERPLLDTLDNPVILKFCEIDESCALQQSIGIRTHGGWSRSFSPDKSWRLYAREDYGAGLFSYPFFEGTQVDHARLVLRNSGNDWNRLRFMDAFWHSVFPDEHVDSQAWRPTRLFVNGEYWGIYNIRERQDEHYVENVHGFAREHVQMLDNSTGTAMQLMRESPALESAPRQSPDDPAVWDEWVAFVERLADGPSGIAALEREVDIASFFDFVIAHTFAAVGDWVENNTRWWRVDPVAAGNTGISTDARWRFMIQDFDSAAFGPRSIRPLTDSRSNRARIVDVRDGRPLHRDGLPFIFVAATDDPVLREMFLNRYADLMNTSLAAERTIRMLDDVVSLLEPEMELSRARWSVGDMDGWYSDVDRLRTFLEGRPDAMRTELVTYFDLDGTAQIEIGIPAGLDGLTINTVDLLDGSSDDTLVLGGGGTLRWSGQYFLGVPISLSLLVAEGYEFRGWSGLPADAVVEDDGSVTLTPTRDLALTVSVTAEQ